MADPTLQVSETLSVARSVAHAAAQLLYRVAVANVPEMSGHEHTNLGWDTSKRAFQTHPLGRSGLMAALQIDGLVLSFGNSELALDGLNVEDAITWLDNVLAENELAAASLIRVTYDLPTDVARMKRYNRVKGLDALAAWFDLASTALGAIAGRAAEQALEPSAIRCWPHHFDIASYVSLESGNAEVARGIGIGMSPGDQTYDQPYFYVNPWPHIDPDRLPRAIHPGHWHTTGFVGSVATGTEILTLRNIASDTEHFLWESFRTGRSLLGI